MARAAGADREAVNLNNARDTALVDRASHGDGGDGGDGAGESAGALLAGIGDEVGRKLIAIESGIAADYALRMIGARRSTPRQELAAMLAALKLARRAALMAARQCAKAEIQGRRAAVTRDRSRLRVRYNAHRRG
jgi:hypothetical protein